MSTIKLGEDLMKIPQLDVAGTNWVIYKDRFLWAIDARGYLDHIDGSTAEPADPISGRDDENKEFTAAETTAELEWKKELKIWKQGEAIVKQQIAATIPDSLFMKIRGKGNALEIWSSLTKEFEKKSRSVAVDLRKRLQDEYCSEKADVRAHFDKLRTMREELAAMGATPPDDDFYSIIMSSMPPSYNAYISAVNGTASVLGTTLSPDDLMQTLTEEADRRTTNTKKTNQRKEENVAFYGNDSTTSRSGSSNWKRGRGGKSGRNIECYNCKKRGHISADCWAKGGGKEGEGPRGKGKEKSEKSDSKALVASANATPSAKGKAKEVDGTWMAMADLSDEENEPEETSDTFHLEDFDLDESDSSNAPDEDNGYFTASSQTSIEDSDSDYASMPGLQVMSDSDSDDDDNESMGDLDDRSEFGDDEDTDDEEGIPMTAEEWNAYLGIKIERNEEDNVPEETMDPFEFLDPTDKAYTTSFTSGMLSKDGIGSQLVDVDLYDSGASRHMSGHRHRFTNFTEIEPRPITAADKRAFHAIGKGDMLIDIPNGDATSKILLKDVLYAPSMGVTLVSISRIAAAGSTVVFSGDNCRIFNSAKTLIGKIEMSQGLYRVYSAHDEPAGYAGRVKELLTIDELHRRLGHVAHEAAKKLVDDGLVKGVELDEESKPTVCVSCEWGKGHRKAIRKAREEEQPDNPGDEVHSDLWGPASVETINRKEYFISFTDGCS